MIGHIWLRFHNTQEKEFAKGLSIALLNCLNNFKEYSTITFAFLGGSNILVSAIQSQ